MKLSIIIVSYNVKYFLEQCLHSVEKAISGPLGTSHLVGNAEVIIIDNASADGSVDWLETRFPSFQFTRNLQNVGFAKANNQALQKARGEFVLFLNPDTIVPENIFQECISFFETNADAGLIGLRMVDGNGKFLPESKRGFPTPWRSFGKMSGLSSLFPRSPFFTGYNLGHLPESKRMVVDALAGAFMMGKRAVLDKMGGFDERFFMYAEDIDLSKRVMDLGLKNYYLGDLCILHFKGESTQRDSQYVKLFYRAMEQYVQKHYKNKGSFLTRAFLRTGIWLRAALAMGRTRSKHADFTLDVVSFIGDEDSINEVRTKLLRSNQPFRESAEAELIICCEGKAFTFSDAIQFIEGASSTKKVMIRARRSESIAGSFDKNGKGIVIPL